MLGQIVCRLVKSMPGTLLVLLLLVSLPLHASNQQPELKSIEIDPETVNLVHPIEVLSGRISSGDASIADIMNAIRIGKPGDVANILSVLYRMGDDPRVRALLYDLWKGIHHDGVDLPWDKLQHPVVRTALAAVMNRIAGGVVPELTDYLRAQADSDIELVQAQVAIALGMSGYLEDVPLLRRYAEGESDYVAESAIIGLAYVYKSEAKQVLIDLLEEFEGSRRGVYIDGILREAYLWKP